MLAPVLFCLVVIIDLSLSHPQDLITDPLIEKQVHGRTPRHEDEIEERDGRIDTKCEGILRPENPDCCFMTDPNHDRTKNWTQPLENSPYKINLVEVAQRTLNKFTKTKFNNSDIWKLTPLVDNEYTKEQTPGGPIKLEVSIFLYCVKFAVKT